MQQLSRLMHEKTDVINKRSTADNNKNYKNNTAKYNVSIIKCIARRNVITDLNNK